MNESAEPRRGAAALLLLVIIAVGGGLRFYHLGSNSLWIDEFVTLRISSLPLGRIVAENIGNNSFEPPLYFWLIHGVVRVFGAAESAIRFPSAVAGVLTIPVVWLLTREITGSRRTALVAAALIALNPLHLWYSQEARPYALLILLVSAACLALGRALGSGSRAAWGEFAGFTLLAVFTHLTGLLLLAVAWGWVATTGNWRRHTLALSGASVLVLVCVGPLLLSIAQASARLPGNGSPPRPATGLEVPYTLFTYVAGYSFGPSLREIQNLGAAAAVAAHPIQTGLVIGVLAVLLVVTVYGYRPCMTGYLALFTAYVVLTFVASVATGKAYSVRYTLPALIGFAGLVSIGLRRTSPAVDRALVALLLMLFTWADAQWFCSPNYAKDDSRAVVRWLAARVPEGAAVVAAPGYNSKVLTYYADLQGAPIHFLPVETTSDSVRPAALLLTRLHHVTDPRSAKEWFRRVAGHPVREDTVGGYQVLSTARTESVLHK